MNARLVVEMNPEEWEAYQAAPLASFITGVTTLEVRQSVLVEERPIGYLAALTGSSFVKPGETAREYRTPGPGPWLEVWPARGDDDPVEPDETEVIG